MKIDKVDMMVYSSNPLIKDIKSIKPYKKEEIKYYYGTVGVAIFDNRTPNIFNENKLTGRYKFLNKIAGYLGLKSYQYEYEKSDSFHDILTKYICNQESGFTKDIHEKFGKCGDIKLKYWKHIGYII